MTFDLEFIIPVRNMSDELDACLSLLVPQLGPSDCVTVVDDGSTDATADVTLKHGAHLLKVETSVGPYAARNLAVSRTIRQGVVFIDARSRANAGLVHAHRSLLSHGPYAMSCTDVEIVGQSFAARVAASQGIFRLSRYIGVNGRLDYFPTMNLGVRVADFRQVGGFRQVRTGGDADLCWRIQEAGEGKLGVDPQTLMAWNARDSFRALAGQWFRYGEGAEALRRSADRQARVASEHATSAARSHRKRNVGRVRGFVSHRPHIMMAILVLHAIFMAGRLKSMLMSASWFRVPEGAVS